MGVSNGMRLCCFELVSGVGGISEIVIGKCSSGWPMFGAGTIVTSVFFFLERVSKC